METKTSLRKKKKVYLLDMLREEYPWKGKWWYEGLSKEEIITKLLDTQNNQ